MCCKAAWTIPGPSSRVRLRLCGFFSIYVDADAELLRTWYRPLPQVLQRRLRILDPISTTMPLAGERGDRIANNIWQDIQLPEICKRTSLPTREQAKPHPHQERHEHAIEQIKLRK